METPKPLSADIHAQIQSLAKRIAADADLDGSLVAELANHLEDKLNAYLAGAESLTEADALLLARHHFGNPEVLRTLIQNTHPASGIFGQDQLARRITIAQAALFAAAIPGRLALELWYRGVESHIVFSGVRSLGTVASGVILLICRSLVILLTSLFFLLLLRRFQQQPYKAPPSLRYLRVKAFRAFLMYILVITASAILLPPMAGSIVPQINFLTFLIHLAIPCASSLIWVWWCYRPPYKLSSLLRTLPAWALAYITLDLCSFGGTLAKITYIGGIIDVPQAVRALVFALSVSLFLALIAATLYATARRVHARVARA